MSTRTRIGSVSAAATLAALLSGCVVTDYLASLPGKADPVSAPSALGTVPETFPATIGRAVPPGTPPHPKEKPIGFTFDPERLLNLTEGETMALAGEPENVRDEPPATVWRYSAGDCMLDVYFYHSVKTETLRSLTYNLLTTSDGKNARVYCLQRVN